MYLYRVESSGLDIVLIAKDHELTMDEMRQLCSEAGEIAYMEGEVRVSGVVVISDNFIDTNRPFVG